MLNIILSVKVKTLVRSHPSIQAVIQTTFSICTVYFYDSQSPVALPLVRVFRIILTKLKVFNSTVQKVNAFASSRLLNNKKTFEIQYSLNLSEKRLHYSSTPYNEQKLNKYQESN